MNFTNRDQIGHFLKHHNLNGIGVELGSFKGEFANTILNNWNGTLLMIDVWRDLPDQEYDDMSNHKEHKDAYSQSMNNIKGFEDRAFMLRMKGKDACSFIYDKYLDFIYIDANHTYEAVKEDIKLWYPKIKSGGLIMGHDYLPDNFYENKEKNQPIYLFPDGQPEKATYAGMFGVNPAVNEFCEENGYTLNKTEEFLATWWFIKR
jgi:hypothetical protein